MRATERRVSKERFIVRVAELLHAQGTPAHRGEELVTRLGRTLRVVTQASFSPTELLLSFGPEPNVRTLVRRLPPGGVQLGRLTASCEVLDDVFAGRVGLSAARRRLESIAAAPDAYGPRLSAAAFGLTAASAAPLLGGGWTEVAVAGVLGAGTGMLERTLSSMDRTSPLAEPLCALAVGALTHALARSVLPHNDSVVALATLIILVPGLSFTVAMVEVATRHWAAGTARIAGAFGTFLSLAVGVAIGRKLVAELLPNAPAIVPPDPVHPLTAALATGAAALSFAILFQARARDWPAIVLACMFGSLGNDAGAAILGPHLGAFVGALVLGLLSNAYTAGGRRPALVLLTPGILLLVPGAVGYRSLDLLMANDMIAGVRTGVDMLIIATSLVAGLLLANGILPPRRPL